MPKKKVILSPFKISFSDSDVEQSYQKNQSTKNRCFVLISLIINFLFIILITILYILSSNKTTNTHLPVLIILIIEGSILILAVCLFIFCKSYVGLQNFAFFLNYLLLCIFFINGKRIFKYSFGFPHEFDICFFQIDFFMKLIWVVNEINDYHYILIGNALCFGINKGMQYHYMNWPYEKLWDNVSHDIFLLIITILSFLYMKKSRELYYCIEDLNGQRGCYRKIIDSMNSGFFKIFKGEIFYANQMIVEMAIKLGIIIQEQVSPVNNSDQCKKVINDNIEPWARLKNLAGPLLKVLIKNIHFTHIRQQTAIQAEEDRLLSVNTNRTTDEEHYQLLLEKIKQIIYNHRKLDPDKKSNKFVYIGTGKIISVDNDYHVYEYYSRIVALNDGEAFEFILNNVTRTKIIEEKNAEIRFKSAILSKIAHEFKNPLICMSEIIDEEVSKNSHCVNNNDNISTSKDTYDNYKSSIYDSIKSISNYLLVLVKNIDLFAQMQCKEILSDYENEDSTPKRINQLNITKCSLNKILEFIQLIAVYLLKKQKADKNVNFIITKNTDIDIIQTDEIKVKQLLINLISNSMKFTHKGNITLTISNDDDINYIKFSIKDTGIGIPKEIQKVLFTSFVKGNLDNKQNIYGAGLGLTISRELSIALGKEIAFSSIEGQGSEFWMSVYIGETCNSSIIHNDKSVANQTLSNQSQETIEKITIPSLNLISINVNPIKVVKTSIEPILSRQATSTEYNTMSPLRIPAVPSLFYHPKSLTQHKDSLNVIIVDDEFLVRKSAIRIVTKYAIKNNLMINIIEASDGLELLWLCFDLNNKNENVDIIISDENMVFYSGNKAAQELKEMTKKLSFTPPKFFLSSAYCPNYSLSSQIIDGFFHKPLVDNDLQIIFKR